MSWTKVGEISFNVAGDGADHDTPLPRGLPQGKVILLLVI
jgi:hypothetical protein